MSELTLLGEYCYVCDMTCKYHTCSDCIELKPELEEEIICKK